MIVLPLLSLLLATTGFAIPHHHGRGHGGGPVPGTVLQSELPSNQTVIVAPNTAANYVAVGVGNQNYTCTSAGTYSSIGAVAMLFDITTLYGTSKFSTIQECVHDAWVNNPSTNPLDPEWDKQVHTQFKLDPLAYTPSSNLTTLRTRSSTLRNLQTTPATSLLQSKLEILPHRAIPVPMLTGCI